MLTIRLFRVGKKNQPAFKIVVIDKRKPARAGRFVEEVGFYNPLKKERLLKPERIKHWLSVGAKASDAVHNLLVKEKIIEAQKIPKHKKSKKPIEEQKIQTAESPTTEVSETVPKEETSKIEAQREEELKAEAPETQVKPEEQKPETQTAEEKKSVEEKPVEEVIEAKKETN